MLKNSRQYLIEWGDCDPACIVYYPRYFEMFDHSTSLLIAKASGMTKFDLLKKYGFVGYPMVDTRAKFMMPTRFGDTVTIESEFTKVGNSSFDVHHTISKDGKLCLEGFDTRVWVGRDPADSSRLKAQPLPAELAARFRGE